MNSHRFFYVVLVWAVIGMTAHAQQGLDAKLKQKTFEKVWSVINTKFYDANFNGTDWKAVHERYSPQVAQAKTESDLYEVLGRMLNELKVSHVGILTTDDLAKMSKPATTTGLGLRMVEGKLTVSRVLADSSAEKEGLKPGYLIKKIDGQEVRTVDDALPKLSGEPNTTVKITYLDAADQERSVTLTRNVVSQSNSGDIGKGLRSYALFDSKRLADNIGYFRFTSFVEFLGPKIVSTIRSMKDAPGIIIDLRGNGGGDDALALEMANMFFDRETQLMITKKRSGDDLYYKAKPQKDPYLGPVVILVNETSGSASEQFTAGMQESGRAYVIGHTTEGEDLDADLIKLPTGAYLLYPYGLPRTPKGVVIEGRGVIPDKEIELTRAGLLAGSDAQLDAAIEYIRSRNLK